MADGDHYFWTRQLGFSPAAPPFTPFRSPVENLRKESQFSATRTGTLEQRVTGVVVD